MTIKLSEEQLAKYGIATQEELLQKLDKADAPKPAAIEQPAAPKIVQVDPATVPDAILARLTALESTVKSLSSESILASVAAEAKRVASMEVSAAIAKSGGAALQQKSQPAEAPQGGALRVDPDDFGAQYDASAQLKERFLSKSSYVKYCEALRQGRIRSHASELSKN